MAFTFASSRYPHQELKSETWLPQPLPVVFCFFSDATNLELLTPPWLRFRVLTEGDLTMRAGLKIDYALRLHGLPLGWRSEIETWEPPHRFVDVQIRGPYHAWRHEHRFQEREGGTMVTDTVRYRAPGGPLVNRYLVRPDLERVFTYRQSKIRELFSAPSP